MQKETIPIAIRTRLLSKFLEITTPFVRSKPPQTKTAAVSRSGFSKSNNNYAMNRPLINTGST
jgi:hypothetical protein